MDINDGHLETIATMVGKFLLKSGGFKNGHCTGAQGEVCINESGKIDLVLPYAVMHVATASEVAELGRRLHTEIQVYMVYQNLPLGLKVKIKSESADEHGSMRTTVMYTAEHLVELYKLEENTRG